MKQRPAKPTIMLVRSGGFPQIWVDEMHATIPEANFVVADNNEESIYAKAKGVNAIIGCPREIFTARLLEHVRDSLLWVHGSGAGVETFVFPEFVESDVLFTNGRIIQGPEVADHAMALLLSLTRKLHGMSQKRLGLSIAKLAETQKKPGNEAKSVEELYELIRADVEKAIPNALLDIPRPIELRGKTALIFGLGGIGMCIAERARGFGMKTIGLANDMPPMVSIVDEFYPHETLMDHIGRADVVFCAAPATAESEGSFGFEQFRAMKNNSYFINVSRGKLVVTEDLVRILTEDDEKLEREVAAGKRRDLVEIKLRGVGLDVAFPDFILRKEEGTDPLPDDHYLRRCERVLATPHMAGPSDHNRRRSFELIQLNIRRFIAGKSLFNPVDKSQGY